ncbi:unnamed protein product [Closterium sp. Yama58-4]|nr:unnamed protein product [Closterium sp. Yama58-4]
MDLVRKFKRRLRSIGGASGITATAGARGSSAECAGDWPSGVISKSFSVECGAPHAGPNPLLGATNSHTRPVPKIHSSNATSDSRLQGKELQLEASGVTISEEEDRRQRSSRPPRQTQRAVSQQQRDAGAGKTGQRCRADECAGDAGESGADHSRESRSDAEDCGSDEIKGDDLQRRHTWQVQSQRHPSDIAAAALPESAKAFAHNRHSNGNRNDDFSYEFEQSASFTALGSLPASGAAALPPRLTEAQLLLIQAAQHASSSGMAIDWARQQQQQHRKVTEWLGTLSDPVEPLTETPFASAELPHETSDSKASHEAAAASLAGRVPRVASCVSPSDSDGRAASLNPPADGDMLATVNRQLKLECAGSPSGTPSPGVPSPRGVIMRGSGGTGSSGDGEEAENDRRKANGRRDCEAIKAEARDDWVPGCERTARRDCKGSCSDGDGSECGGDLEGGSPSGKWGADDAVCKSKQPGAIDNASLTSVRVAYNQLVATRQSEQVRGAKALRDLARESDAVRSSIVAVGAIPALVSIVNLAASAPHAAATRDTTVASLMVDSGGCATPTGASLSVRPRLVHAGAVPLLLELVGHAATSHLTCSSSRSRGAERRTQRTSRTEDDAVATAERALAVLALLAESEEGRAEVQRRGGMEVLVGVVRAGGPSGTCVERAIAGLTAMVGGSLACRWEVAKIGMDGAVKEVAIHGSGKAKVKAIKFMDMLRAPPALG